VSRSATIGVEPQLAAATFGAMVENRELVALMRVIGAGDTESVVRAVSADPALAQAALSKGVTNAAADEFFLESVLLQIYVGDTALHVAAAAYESAVARCLVGAGASVRARNRRGAEPIHAAVTGSPATRRWDPVRQVAMIGYLVAIGADPDAPAAGGVTPLHRAVRNRCSAAVRALLEAGADPRRTNDHGSTALMLATLTTGRGGSGSPEARREQAIIVELLESVAD